MTTETHDAVVACPECGFEIRGGQISAEVAHMQKAHPEVIEQRLIDAGFIMREDGTWEDVLAGGD